MRYSLNIAVHQVGDVAGTLRTKVQAHQPVDAKFVVASDPGAQLHCMMGVPVAPNIFHHAEMLRLLLNHLFDVKLDPKARGRLPRELVQFVFGGGQVHVESEEDRVLTAANFASGTLIEDVGSDSPKIPTFCEPILLAVKAWVKTVAVSQ